MTRILLLLVCLIASSFTGIGQRRHEVPTGGNNTESMQPSHVLARDILQRIGAQYDGPQGTGAASAPDTESDGSIVLAAMKDELERNLKRLRLDELQPPFFISYEVRDVKRTLISATLGSLIQSSSNRTRTASPRLMVGDYNRNDENFLDISSSFSGGFSFGSAMPLEDDYFGIRRALWLTTDGLYKSAADTYEKKLAAIEQQNLTAEVAELPDFSKEKPVTLNISAPPFAMESGKWEALAKDVSTVFLEYPEIQSSRVSITLVDAMLYYVNSEGTRVSYPLTLAAMQIVAHTQAEDGETLNEHATFTGATPTQLPDLATAKRAAKDLAESLEQLRTAATFDGTYTGPVLFEGQAVAEVVSQRLFMESDGLIATRDQISSSPGAGAFMGAKKSLGDRIGQRLLPKELSIAATPSKKHHKGLPCIGAFEVDREGVVPPENLILVEEGKLVTLLNNRIPSKEVRQSNGHSRMGTNMEAGTAPGVIHVYSSKPSSATEMKDALLQAARDEGLKHAFIIRKISSPTVAWEEDIDIEAMFTVQFSGGGKKSSIRQPILVYRVDVETGKETLMRSVQLGNISTSALRDIAAVEDKEYVYNTLTNPSSGGGMGFIIRLAGNLSGASGGFPSTFIVPNSMLFEEMEIKPIDRVSTPKLPIVKSPLADK